MHERYVIYFPSIRSASEVYVNGEFIDGFGQVGMTRSEYVAKNLSLMVTFTPDEHENAEIVV